LARKKAPDDAGALILSGDFRSVPRDDRATELVVYAQIKFEPLLDVPIESDDSWDSGLQCLARSVGARQLFCCYNNTFPGDCGKGDG
jgi:hypothetical protein